MYVYSQHDIVIQSRERLCIYIDLMVIFGRPLLFSNPLEENEVLCCFQEILRQKDMTVIEKIELLNHLLLIQFLNIIFFLKNNENYS